MSYFIACTCSRTIKNYWKSTGLIFCPVLMKQQDIRSAFHRGTKCSVSRAQSPEAGIKTEVLAENLSAVRAQTGPSSKSKRKNSNIEQDGAAKKKPLRAGTCIGKAGTTALGDGAYVDYYPEAFSAEESSALFNRLKVFSPCAETPCREIAIHVTGKSCHGQFMSA